jgi:hypothetical protein
LTQAGGFASAWEGQVAGATLVPAAVGSDPAVLGDGSLQFASNKLGMSVSPFVAVGPATVYLLAKALSSASGSMVFSGADAAEPEMYATALPTLGISNDAVGNLEATATFDTFQVLQAVFDGTGSVFQIDDEVPATGDAGVVGGFSAFYLGSFAATGESVDMVVKEMLVYSAAHDDTQRAAVRAYLATV